MIGLGQYGYQVASSLAELKAEVLAIDRDPEVIESIKRVDGVHPLCLDATDEAALRATGVEDVEAAVVAIGQHLEVSIVVTALLERMAVRRIIARASTDLHKQILRDVGASHVHNPEVEMGMRDARSLFSPGLRDRMQLPTGQHVVEIDAKESIWGQSLSQLDFRTRNELMVIAIQKSRPYVNKRGETAYRTEMITLPTGSDLVEEGDVLTLVGTEVRVRELLELWQ